MSFGMRRLRIIKKVALPLLSTAIVGNISHLVFPFLNFIRSEPDPRLDE